MSMDQLAERFANMQLSTQVQTKNQELETMSYEQLMQLPIKFGSAKIGQTYEEIINTDPKYCQWFLKTFASSSKIEHQEFRYVLQLWIERMELENGAPSTQGDLTNPVAKAKSKAKAKAHSRRGSAHGAPSQIPVHLPDNDLVNGIDEDEAWDELTMPVSPTTDMNAQRINQLEGVLNQVVSQLQALTRQNSELWNPWVRSRVISFPNVSLSTICLHPA